MKEARITKQKAPGKFAIGADQPNDEELIDPGGGWDWKLLSCTPFADGQYVLCVWVAEP